MCDLKMTAGNRALMVAIKESGPVAIGINANNLQFYESGIIDAASCPPAGRGIQSINHAAIVVGWGEENGKKYWLVKNSYGEDFGENGYFRLEREHPNLDTLFGTCGLLFESVYPVVTEAGVELGEPELQCTEGVGVQEGLLPERRRQPGRLLASHGRGGCRRRRRPRPHGRHRVSRLGANQDEDDALGPCGVRDDDERRLGARRGGGGRGARRASTQGGVGGGF